MSQDFEKKDSLFDILVRYWMACLCAGIIVAAILAFFIRMAGTSVKQSEAAAARTAAAEDTLREARAALVRETDLATCRATLGRINGYLSEHADLRPASVGNETQNQLAKTFGLDSAELSEISSTGFTSLDGRYLDECLLFRDAARSLDVDETGSEGAVLRPEALDRAVAAFKWVIRQVRPNIYDPDALLNTGEQEFLPPSFTLRRGWGDPLERAVVFLTLLQQDSGPERLRGLLLTVPGTKPGARKFWACGVIVGDDKKKIYLFDPRVGLPVPGADGKGVATLTEVVNNPTVLHQLDVDDKQRYDITPELAGKAEGLGFFALSSLAPRMRHLQESLLKNALNARLPADPSDLEFLREAGKESGVGQVVVWKPGVRMLRQFLSIKEGGTDEGGQIALRDIPGFTTPTDATVVKLTRLERFEWALVPWEVLPREFNPRNFPITVGLGQRVREYFASPFVQPMHDAHSSRELLIRGHSSQAVPKLVNEDGELLTAAARPGQTPELDSQVADWLKRARDAYATQQRAIGARDEANLAKANKQIDGLWKAATPVYVLLLGAAAMQRDGEVTYQLALCKHEQAEQYQARLDLLTRAKITPASTDLERCKQAWTDAKDWWERFDGNFGRSVAGPPARQNRGRAEAMLGNWAAAADIWKDTSGYMAPSEKLAAVYRSRQAQKEITAKK
jgi:hypothetical protein